MAPFKTELRISRHWLGLLGTSLVLVSNPVAGGEDNRFEATILELAAQLTTILIDKGVCRNLADCQRAQVRFVSPATNGIAVQVWGVTDGHIIDAISAACASAFFRQKELGAVFLDVYSISKAESLGQPFWKSSKLKYEIIYRRVQ